MSDGVPAGWRLDERVRVGPLELRGRVFVPAHQPGLADRGLAGERYVAYQRARARAGAAMQITGAMPVAPSDVWAGFALTAAEDTAVEGFKRVAEAVHAEGGRMLGQLAHAGPTELGGPDVIGPARFVSEVTRQVVRPARAAELDRVVEQFAAAAVRCVRGELDGVEVSLAHGLLLAAFLSPFTNPGADRLAFPLRVLAAVRDAAGRARVVGVRLAANELVDGGITPESVGAIAAAVEPHADYVNVTIGNNNALEARVRHWAPTPSDSSLFREAARAVRAVVTVPVGMAGRIVDLEEANRVVAAGDADLVGMVRAHIADPALLAKARSGRRREIRPCVGANVCVNRSLTDQPIACLVNPDLAGEPSLPSLEGRSALVAGAGPAGLEAARRLALRGAAVTVCERAERVGGQMADWALAPSRAELVRGLDWWMAELARLGVVVRLGCEAGLADAVAADIVVVATGASPAPLEGVPDDGSVPVVDAITALREGVGDGRAVVYDILGEIDAMLVCERLSVLGARSVTLATSRVHAGEGEGITTLFPMLRRLASLGVATVERVRLEAVEGGRVRLAGVFGGPVREVEADVLVPWLGGVSRSGFADALRGAGREPIVVGDALRPRRAHDAVAEAARAIDAI